jgi:DNA-binding transcriptional ArsR family regulator
VSQSGCGYSPQPALDPHPDVAADVGGSPRERGLSAGLPCAKGASRWRRSTRGRPNGRLRRREVAGSVVGAVPLAVSSPRQPAHTPPRRWTFITNHAQVLLAVAQAPNARVREIAAATDITERYAYRVLRDLEDAGYVERRREGRCNLYRIHRELALGDPIVEDHSLWEFLRLIETSEGEGADVVAMTATRGRPAGERLRRKPVKNGASIVQKHERPFSCGRLWPHLGFHKGCG